MMNMFQKVKADSVASYLSLVPKERKEIINSLHKFIRKVTPALKPHFASNMLGYGSFQYKNSKKEVLNWPVVALANQKNYVSLYVCSVVGGEYLAEKYEKDLGKVNVGRSCIRFKKLSDLNLKTLEKVLKLAAKSPGLV